MERIIGSGFRELIGSAFGIIPREIVDKIQYVHFLTGIDPVYAGLHPHRDTGDNRSYCDTAHVAYPCHQRLEKSLRHTTIVLPSLVSLDVLVHELGHVLDESLEFIHIAKPVTEYAKVDRGEAFAEAFTSWLFWDYGKDPDEATRYLFESLTNS